MGQSGSGSNFTDYAGVHKGPPDALRGATSYPINQNHRTAYAYLELYGSDGQEPGTQRAQRHAPSEGSSLAMKRSRSLALPASLVVEASGGTTHNRNPYKAADQVTRSQRQMSLQVSDVSASPAMIRAQLKQQQLQQNADKGAPKGRVTTQSMESTKAAWLTQNSNLAQNAIRDLDSPRVGSGFIKVSMGQGFEEDGRVGPTG